MKTTQAYLFLAAALLAAGCTRENPVPAPSAQLESLEISGEVLQRVRLSDGINAVWSIGDQVSVFYNGGENECWDYTGNDGAATGTISHNGSSDRSGKGTFTALYPYDPDASLSGDILSTSLPAVQDYVPDSYGGALLAARTDNRSLRFHYACAFVRVRIWGYGEVAGVSLQTTAGEKLSGPVLVDLGAQQLAAVPQGSSGADCVSLQGKDGATLETLHGDTRDFYLAVIPVSCTQGLSCTVSMKSGLSRTFPVSDPVTLTAGSIYDLSCNVVETSDIGLVFSSKNATTPALPTSSTKEDGTFSFTSGGADYQITLHAGPSTASYGYAFAYGNCLLIGRAGAYISVPVRSGYSLYEVEYTAGSTSGKPYLTDKTDGTGEMLSNPTFTTVADMSYPITLQKLEQPGKQYYMWVSTGNLRICAITFRYIKESYL